MEAIFFIPLTLGVLLVLALLGAYVIALYARRQEPREYPDADFTDPAGFRMTSLPELEFLTRQRNLLRNGCTAELEFTADPGWHFLLRVCLAKGDLSLYDFPGAFAQRAILYMGRIRVIFLQSPGGPALALWTKEGFDYALYFKQTEMGLAGSLMCDFVHDACAEAS